MMRQGFAEQLDVNTQINLLRGLIRIRVVEETLAERYKEQAMKTPTHFAIGQEAVAMGVCGALALDDIVYTAHRSHAQYLAKGGDLTGLVAELYGRETGASRGRGGSVHLTDPKVGFIASSAILGQTIAVAVGSALAFAMDSEPRVAVCFFGDGAIDEGIFHESLNFASLHKLPTIFVCENNLYSTHTPISKRQPPNTQIFERAASYSIEATQIDGNDVEAVYNSTVHAKDQCLAGNGPVFLECMTYRWNEHVGPYDDYDQGYRSEDEVNAWKKQDPIKKASQLMISRGNCTAEDVTIWSDEASDEVAAAVELAKASPFPNVENILDDIY